MEHSDETGTFTVIPTAKKAEEDFEEEMDMDSEEEGHRGGHKRCFKRGKNSGLPPRKAIKKLIFQELETSAPQIFEQLMKCKEIGQPF